MGTRKKLKILVVGGFGDGSDHDELTLFGQALGAEIVRQGHVLISGNRVGFDRIIAEGAKEACKEKNIAVDDRIYSWFLDDHTPHFDFGRLHKSQRKSWDPGVGFGFIPEPIEEADVVVLVKGGKGTNRAAHWSRFTNKPLLPVTRFGGAAELIYRKEYEMFDEKYSGSVDKLTYETLSEIGANWEPLPKRVVHLAEDISFSESVFVSMPYVGEKGTLTELDKLFDAFETVCRQFRYQCQRISEEDTRDRIVPAIMRNIEVCGFFIIDLTNLKPNLFYELGYAKGLDKDVIATARKGTVLPFDVKDIPVTFWDPVDLKTFSREIAERVKIIAKTQGK